MFADFFKRLQGRISPRRSRAPEPLRAPEPQADDQPSSPGTEPSPLVRATDAPDLHAWLALEVRTRVAELHNVLASDGRASDAPRFLDAICENFDAVIRQPPLAAQRALAVTRDQNASATRIVGLVEKDPGLGQALLRYANTAYYATGGDRCVSLHGAVQRVGTSGVHNVVLRAMVDGILCRPGVAYQRYVDETWQHMVRTAPVARALAHAFGTSPDESYALGLLHDVGKLVIFDRLVELRRTLRRDAVLPDQILSLVLKTLHEPLGGIAALQWGLGAGVAHAIATHHRLPVPEMYDPRGELIFVAERLELAHTRGQDPAFERWWRDGLVTTPRDGVERAATQAELEASQWESHPGESHPAPEGR